MKIEERPLLCVEIRITADHGTWQGTIRTEWSARPFASELELLRTIEDLLPPLGGEREEEGITE